jgi:hypothetical protein
MIRSDMTVTHQRPPYIYGEILSRSLWESPGYELPGFGRSLSQGIVVGAFVSFLWPVIGMLSHPENGYNFLLISWLPVFLATGMGFGLFEGGVIWACSYIAGHRLNAVARAGVGIVVLAILLVTFNYFYSDRSVNYDASLKDWLFLIAIYSAIGAVFGLVIGSKFSPLSELLRGTMPPRRLILNGITGFLLRVLIIYAMMASTLILIWIRQIESSQKEFAFAAIAVSYCMAATVILFTRMPFWLLLLLALLINFPIAVLITDVLTKEQVIERNFIIAYLTLWTAFLLCRVSVPQAVLSFVKKEIRYYLID